MLRPNQDQVTRLSDYRPTDFRLATVDMRVQLFAEQADVLTLLTLERRDGSVAGADLVLDGDELTLVSLTLDGAPLDTARYDATPQGLTIRGLPDKGSFTLAIETRLQPQLNTKLMGLYRSNGVWCTQCEAEGFRRITYFPDRPDVLATYRVRIEADKAEAPVLLSNGNPAEHGLMEGGRHFAVWDDPFPKPSYLFALVAGDLDRLGDHFTTMSGRRVALDIYTEKGRAHEALYAMDALKRSMVWDEKRFGREYDLDVFSIVAISDFNMGAMENKGLNVFNHKYVLLDPETATDGDYAGVETVIAHEYFHNWTGNRITCRDWFQLCLKEGLTVYRDQEFSADERSAAVKRIASVRGLTAHQFPEDQGPLQHPVRPSEYKEISNFYTATIYDKGAELVRMIATIVGEKGFRAGMDLYFERHDGDAATIEDFLACFVDATGADLTQFARWYSQAGTPVLKVAEQYDADRGELTLTLSQNLAQGPAGTGTLPLHIPVRFGLVGANGHDIEPVARVGDGGTVTEDVIHLRGAETTVVFEGLGERPYVSILRDFSAPVALRTTQRESDRLALARLDGNPFNRWRALSDLVGEVLQAATIEARGGGEVRLDPAIADALIATGLDETLEPALRAQALSLPSEADIARLLGENVDPDAIHTARRAVVTAIAQRGEKQFIPLFESLVDRAPFSPDAASAGRRALSSVLLDFLLAASNSPDRAAEQYRAADNMTEQLTALTLLCHRFPEDAATRDALADFYRRFEGNALVIDKWFSLQATAPSATALQTVRGLAGHPAFRLANPNRARALIGAFAAGNQVGFNRADGAGYAFVAEMIQALDELNPQIAARIATAFRSWRCFESVRREKARAVLAQLIEKKNLSTDLKDIVERSLR
ncbi:aminopeptidase N [Aureimonas sp. SA4125]|uniref:aminopeptidase N n=1 Tax=Aureimonas sp. SA4125 TaxID=2826993 RepID=UPI001CC3F040|nr:aminopeptidase N [Aureimonas sp. SA4125]BDA83726.1 aminopeptidase N [Aureimonas sp. SA4125]